MAKLENKVEELLATLRRERDELRVQLHLGKAEVKEEWEELEQRYDQLEKRVAAARKEAAASSESVGQALTKLGEELKGSYRRITARLKD